MCHQAAYRSFARIRSVRVQIFGQQQQQWLVVAAMMVAAMIVADFHVPFDGDWGT